jgi:hypothetical protein
MSISVLPALIKTDRLVRWLVYIDLISSMHSIELLVLNVSDSKINLQQPVVYADSDANASEIAGDGSGTVLVRLLSMTIWK